MNRHLKIVIKLSGKLLDAGPERDLRLSELRSLHARGHHIVVVHGGGKQLTQWTKRLNIPETTVLGRRVTDADTLELAKMTFAGSLNTDLTAGAIACGLPAVGISGVSCGVSGGVSGGLVTAERRPPRELDVNGSRQVVDYGYVGDIVRIESKLLDVLLENRFVPVIAPLGVDTQRQVLNINADTIAVAIAAAIAADHIFLLGDTDGVYRDRNDSSSLIPELDAEGLDAFIASNNATDGMIPKLMACKTYISHSAGTIHIGNGYHDDVISRALNSQTLDGQLVSMTQIYSKKETSWSPSPR